MTQGDPTVDGSITTQSHVIEGETPQGVINSYEDLAHVRGWESADGPTKTGEDVYQLEMVENGASLTVTAGLDGSDVGAGQDRVELSLQVTAT